MLTEEQKAAAEVDHSVCLLAGPGTGKALHVDEPVLTPSGWKSIGDIRPGDFVISGSTGRPVAVDGVYPQGVKPIFRVEFSDGTWSRCCDEHLWFTTSRRERKRGGKGSVKTVNEIRHSLTRGGDGSPNHMIPMTTTVEFERQQALPVDPYLLGVLLGDGSIREESVDVYTPDADVLFEIFQLVPASCRITKVSNIGFGCEGLSIRKTNCLTR